MTISSTTLSAGAALAALAALLLVLFGAPAAVVAIVVLAAAAVAAAAWWVSRREAKATEESLAKVAHELRTPLTSVVGILELLDDDSPVPLEPEERIELLSLARQDSLLLSGHVANLHVASRIARDLLEPKRDPIDLRGLCVAAINLVPSVAGRTYVAHVADPGAMGDRGLVLQILTNLVQNSERYAAEGSIEVGFEHRGDRICLYFSDDGPGIVGRDRERVFRSPASRGGLGLGLGLSRELARAMGGDLEIVDPRRSGATFALELPRAVLPDRQRHPDFVHVAPTWAALAPRSRVLLDMTEALTERSLDRMVAGLQKLYSGLLGAAGGVLMAVDPIGGIRPAGSFGTSVGADILADDPLLAGVIESGLPIRVEQLDSSGPWPGVLGGDAALFMPVADGERSVGVLAIGWSDATGLPDGGGFDVAVAMSKLAALAISRSSHAADAEFERRLRSSVMEALPIAISVFAGDPPRVVDWNRRERLMLGIHDDAERPSDLDASQHKYEVRFADGTPLTVENAPVTRAIRTGQSAGPFLLLVRRPDGSEVVTRTYCAPFHDGEGGVTGAVVTSEEIDVASAVSPGFDVGEVA
jgi:PAS domain-containing protein